MLAVLLSLASSNACTLACPCEWRSSENCGGTTTANRASAPVNLLDDVAIVVRGMNNREIVRGLEMLQQILAGLRPIAVVHAEGNVLDVQIHAVAVNEKLHDRHGEDDQEAARVAPDLDDFLAHHGEDAAQAHAALPGLDSCAAVRVTKTSSRLG